MNDDSSELEKRISNDLKELERLMGVNRDLKANLIFPGGVIKTAWTYREILPFITDDCLRRNIAYHLMVDDIFRWLLLRFNFYLVANAMLIKIAIANFGTIIEALIIATSSYLIKPERENEKSKEYGVKTACSILVKNEIISKELKKRIKWVWDTRNKQHLVSLRNWEYERYEIEDYYKSIGVFNELIAELNLAYDEKKFVYG